VSTQKGILEKTAITRLKDNRMKMQNYQRIVDIASPFNTIKSGF